jgi:leucyl aminopeptidase (aminopeptidase T)
MGGPIQARPGANLLDGRVTGADMPLYMDTHRKVKGVTAAAVAEAHAKDLKVQGKHGVDYRNYWVDEKSETIYCLVEAPNPEAAARVHKEAHGLVADEIHEVHQG